MTPIGVIIVVIVFLAGYFGAVIVGSLGGGPRSRGSPFSYTYLDNNATTPLLAVAKREYENASYFGNPSSSYSGLAKKKLESAREYFLGLTGGSRTIFTSGASESNALVIRSFAAGNNPFIISSAIEHKSILTLLEQLAAEKKVEFLLIPPNENGEITPAQLESTLAGIGRRVSLVTIMAANNETGAVNNTEALHRVCQFRKIPFHTDATQLFKVFSEGMKPWGDFISVSFHKIGGPVGVGALICRDGSEKLLVPQISGAQQDGIRGGTENVPAISAAVVACQYTLENRREKNNKLRRLTEELLVGLRKHLREGRVADFYKLFETDTADVTNTPMIGQSYKHHSFVVIGNPQLPGTLLISFITPVGEKKFCNLKLKSALDEKHIFVSIGSACNTGKIAPSHVLGAMRLPHVLRCGVVRISMWDQTTSADIKKLLRAVVPLVLSQ